VRILMLSTGGFGGPTLRALLETRHEVLGLVTRPRHGGRRAAESPMRREAALHEVPVLAPERVSSDEGRAQLAALAPDLLVVCDYGEILSAAALAAARLGGINLHGSLLPKYRGAAPVHWALFHGEAETGVTVIQMTPGLDAGPCLAQARTAILPDETAVELESRLARLGAALVCQVVDDLAADRARPAPQDPRQATQAPRLRKEHGLVDWGRSAESIRNQVRAMQPWPAAFTFWRRREREPLRLILHEVAVTGAEFSAGCGTVVQTVPKLVVATGQGGLEVLKIQPAGGRVLPATTFLRGYPLQVQDPLGPPPACKEVRRDLKDQRDLKD